MADDSDARRIDLRHGGEGVEQLAASIPRKRAADTGVAERGSARVTAGEPIASLTKPRRVVESAKSRSSPFKPMLVSAS